MATSLTGQAQQIQFDGYARQTMLRGVEQLSKAVKTTLGPRGGNVILEKRSTSPTVTRDGLSIAEEIELEDPFENIGAQFLREVAKATSEAAGDGTTTATVLAENIFRGGVKNLVAGANPIAMQRGIEMAVTAITDELARISKTVKSKEEIKQVAIVAANWDTLIGEIIADALDKVGKDGTVTVQESKGFETYLDIVEGMHFDRGYLSPYFVTNAEGLEAVLENCYVLIHEKRISSLKEILPLLEKIAKSGSPLLVIAEEVEGEALATLVVNKLRGTTQFCAVKAPGSGDRRKAILEDIAVLTGGRVMSQELGFELQNVTLEDLGRAKRIVVDKDSTTIIEGRGTNPEIQGRVSQIRRQIERTTSDNEQEQLQDRLAKLAGGVAVISVGAATETAMKEKKSRIEDALRAARAAVEEGIVPGGGVALIRCQKALDKLELFGDEAIGVQIIRRAVEQPLRTLVDNAGGEASVVINEIKARNGNEGYNVATGEYLDLMKAGIIDPTKVVRTALLNASSISGLLLTTEVSISSAQKTSSTDGDAPSVSRRLKKTGISVSKPSARHHPHEPESFKGATTPPVPPGGSKSSEGAGPPDRERGSSRADEAAPPPEKCINAWIEERRESSKPLDTGKPYTLSFMVGRGIIGNLVAGEESIVPMEDVPEDGLDTKWVITVSNLTLKISPANEVQVESDPVSGWAARFPLHVPVIGDSLTRSLSIVPISAGTAKVNVFIYARAELYRQFTIVLAVGEQEKATPGEALQALEASEPTAQNVGPSEIGSRTTSESDESTGSMAVSVAGPTTVESDFATVPFEQLGLKPAHDWADPGSEIALTIDKEGRAHLQGDAGEFGSIGVAENETWLGVNSAVTNPIQNLRQSAEAFREKWSSYLNDIDPDDLERRLAAFIPKRDWMAANNVDSRHQAAWNEVSVSDEMRALAQDGYTLFQACFRNRTALRAVIDQLQVGQRFNISLTQESGAYYVPHIPWGLMYCQEPPDRGKPVDPMAFLGLRYRIAYRSDLGSAPKNLGSLDNTHGTHFFYWGDGRHDVTELEARAQRAKWSAWRNQLLLPDTSNLAIAKSSVIAELANSSRSPNTVIYLYCKCKVGEGNQAELRFGPKNETDVLRRTDLPTTDLRDRPLVFANACTTTGASAFIPNELRRIFTARGCRGFLGTEIKVPIAFSSRYASTFFHFFYERFDGKPVAVGEAAVQARRLFWTEYANIGGLFYSYVNQYELFMADANEIGLLKKNHKSIGK
jgi:chaperonin GroEL